MCTCSPFGRITLSFLFSGIFREVLNDKEIKQQLVQTRQQLPVVVVTRWQKSYYDKLIACYELEDSG